MACVYVVTNLINGKQYVGKTIDFERRKYAHLYYAYRPKSVNFRPINAAIAKYGPENFKWEVIFESSNEQECFQKELELTKSLKTLIPNGYNQVLGGGGSMKDGPAIVECIFCGKRFQVERRRYNSNKKRGLNFVCSPECNSANKSLNATGVNNSHYIDGRSMRHV